MILFITSKLDKKGFTIVETVVAIFVFTLILSAVAALIVMIYRTQAYAMQQTRAVNHARRGVECMTKEIRQAISGDNGAYPIEMGMDKQIVFYSDIDGDGRAERVRYFLATVNSGSQTLQCSTNTQGGSCGVTFFDFLTETGLLTSAQVKISVEGDFANMTEHAIAAADGVSLGGICQTSGECGKCAGFWQGAQTFDITDQARDGLLQLTVDASDDVNYSCSWQGVHKMRAQFIFSFVEEIPNLDNTLKKGVIYSEGIPPAYPSGQEQISIVSSFVHNNTLPVFTYYDENGNQIIGDAAILRDTKMVKLFMVVNVDLNRSPSDYRMEQYVQIRNLRD